MALIVGELFKTLALLEAITYRLGELLLRSMRLSRTS